MFKRCLAVFFAALMIFTVGCSDDNVAYENLSDYESEAEVPEEENRPTEEKTLAVNPLTGVAELEDDAIARQRPVAIMVNNVKVAQSRQTGLADADIIYETEVEGGITRLMAVYQDISDLDKIGTVRSARYPYVDLALGHDAIYVHCGQDPTYCKPHLADIDDIDIDTNVKGAKRIANGLSSEHTLYALAGDLWENINDKFDTKASSTAPWVDFTDEKLILDGGSATSVAVPFPIMTTNFTYDASTGLYTRLSGGTVLTDYYSGESTQVKNVFILLTSISDYPDGEHRKVALKSGDGYYITNGTVQFIKWSKGDADNGFKFTDTSGNKIKVSAGNSWVCIANKTTCDPVIK